MANLQALMQDVIHSLRIFRKDPGYAAIIILLLALGIGANTAIFSVTDSVLLRPLGYADSNRLVVALHGGDGPVSPADYLDYKKDVRAFQDMAAAQVWGAILTQGGRPQQIPGLCITANMLKLLGVAPMLGRSFRSDEEHGANSRVLLLSYGLWERTFSGDRNIVGKLVSLDRVPYTVVGIMPPNFRFAPFWATRAQMWAPLVLDHRLHDRGGDTLRVFARLKAGITIKQAQSEMDAVAARLAERYPQTNAKLGITVVPLLEKVVHSVRPMLLVLLGTVGFVLLIACATVANLILARAVTRRKELALRLALGASRAHLIRLNLFEIVVLAIVGGLLGLLIADWSLHALALILPPDSLPRQSEIGIGFMALEFAAAVTLLSVLFAGLIPAIQASRTDLIVDLKEGNRGSSAVNATASPRFAFIAVEVALSLILLAGAGLMTRTLLALYGVNAGFNPRHLLTMQIAVSGTDYDQNGRRINLFHELRSRIAAVPEIESVSAINHLPVGGDVWTLDYTIEGRPKPAPGDEISAVYRVVMSGYFHTMQIGLLAGRAFDAHDNQRAPSVAIINEAMAKRRWPGESALGKIIHFGVSDTDRIPPRIIVGVVRDARQGSWTSSPNDEIYLPYDQRPDSMGLSELTFVLRTTGDPNALAYTVTRQVNAFDRSLAVFEIASMEQVIADDLWRQRLATVLMAAFAGLAVLLAFAGIYGVISHSMRNRTQEIGIRMALGAGSVELLVMALRQGMKPVLIGALAGFAIALLLTQFLNSLLFGVSPADPTTFAGVSFALLSVCVIANLIPAARAVRMDALIALRHD